MVGCKATYDYNRAYARYDIQLPYQLGDIKGLETVAHYEKKDNMIFFVKTLTIVDARKVINKADEIKMLAIKIEREQANKERHFELDPDGLGEQ